MRYILFLLLSSCVFAQLTITSPSTNEKVATCQDYFVDNFGSSLEMNNSSDVLNNFPKFDVNGLSNVNFSGSKFIMDVAHPFGQFYLISPTVCGSYPVSSRFTHYNPIDTSKYDKFIVKMYSSQDDSEGLRLIWERSCNYGGTRTFTSGIPLKKGWHIYEIDLKTVSLMSGSGLSQSPWVGGLPITGLAVMPSIVVGNHIEVDWIKFADSSTCQSRNVSFTNVDPNNYATLYLDDDSTPFNGYIKKITKANAGTSDSINAPLNFSSGTYKVYGLLDSDYATIELDNPWDFNDSSDVFTTVGLNVLNYNSGVMNSVSTSSNPVIYLKLGTSGIDLSKYNKLSFRLSGASSVYINWGTAGIPTSISPVVDDLFQVDLTPHVSGVLTNLIIIPNVSSGANLGLDFVSLTKNNYETNRDQASIMFQNAGGNYTVNALPEFNFVEPDLKGGEAIRAWNMRPKDVVLTQNLLSGSSFGELNTCHLPDVRTVDGLRGDFFKGTSTPGNDDPTNWFNFPFFNAYPFVFSADEYKNLCFKLFVDTRFDVGEGSVARVLWQNTLGVFKTSEDLVTVYDGWKSSRWQEYCLDMSKLYLDGTTRSDWSGNIQGFRVDPHEFHYPATPVSYYFDYVKLRKDDEANQSYSIVYDLSDFDDTASVNFYYSSIQSISGGTLINPSPISALSNTRVYVWNTSSIPDGTYYLYAEITDGYNTVKRQLNGRLKVNHSKVGAQSPVLNIESPNNGYTSCSQLQVKGYSLIPNKFEDVSIIEVLIDGNLYKYFKPSIYSPKAVTDYPNADSSNSGFNEIIDVTGLSDGAHTVEIKAYNSDGNVTINTYSFNKNSAGGCTGLISDPASSGIPTAIDPGLLTPSVPFVAVKHNSKTGLLTLTIIRTTESQKTCNNLLEASVNGINFTVVKNIPANVTKKILNWNKVFFINKNLKNLYFRVTKSCSGYSNATSNSAKLIVKTKKGLKTLAQVVARLNRSS